MGLFDWSLIEIPFLFHIISAEEASNSQKWSPRVAQNLTEDIRKISARVFHFQQTQLFHFLTLQLLPGGKMEKVGGGDRGEEGARG